MYDLLDLCYISFETYIVIEIGKITFNVISCIIYYTRLYYLYYIMMDTVKCW